MILLARSSGRVEGLFVLFDPLLLDLFFPNISFARASFFFLCRSRLWGQLSPSRTGAQGRTLPAWMRASKSTATLDADIARDSVSRFRW